MATYIQRPGIRAVVASIVVSVILVTASVFGSAAPARANAGACQTPSINIINRNGGTPNACVRVETGWKDSRDHTEWVGHVEVDYGKTPDDKLEIWGDGFYYVGRGMRMEIYVDKRVRHNTYVCGATSDYWGVRTIACIHIKV